ncbi:anti-sigma factor antagonist [Umezawaea sp. Da 62-37]|uniref:STAS domain-containing protein n=1 Tax=Umezawaea sp. Da 62-37 TaxID=3075927 RepID=UPI0028F6C0D2|nr:anti-sigma factor antagonist [Umezawaea sp. Da 62-37]WNV87056.1 anti-sigma factor antagonist [Umezawaea sp. Da 62-37]
MPVRERPSAPRPFAITVARHPRAVVVAVRGELDHHTATQLRAVLNDVHREEPQVIVIDLHDVSLLASAGLAALIAAHDQALPDTEVRLVATSATPAMRSVRLTGLEELFVVHATAEAALKAS